MIGGMMAKQNLTTIRGIVLASGWGEDGGISAVDIAGYDEKRYRVVSDAMGRKLKDHVRRQVVARGWVTTREHRLSIYVCHFQIEDSDSQLAMVKAAKEI